MKIWLMTLFQMNLLVFMKIVMTTFFRCGLLCTESFNTEVYSSGSFHGLLFDANGKSENDGIGKDVST
jgi:hypothetical protein